MKAKLNFDLKAIQGFLLAHVEKFVFALVILVFLTFVSGAMKWTGYDKTPKDLEEVATRAEKNIESTPPPPVEYTDQYLKKAEGIRDPIEVTEYRYQTLWTTFLWPERPEREQPLLYTVEELAGKAGHGAVRVRNNPTNPQSGPGVIGQRWVVITGLIPYEKQLDAYEEAFAKAEFHDPSRDVPKIVYYRVERREMASPGDATQAPWKLLNLRSRLSVISDVWNGSTTGVVDGRYIHQGVKTPIAFPLPPLDSGSFGREVAHDPEIPLAVEEMAEAEQTEQAPVTEEKSTEDEPPDLPPGLRPETEIEEVVEEETNPYQLFRFFDFEVEPGKHYQYRVRLMLANPNYEVERRFLADDSLREDPYLDTDWSEPSDVITVPRDSEVLAGSVKPPPGGRVTMEPKANVGILYFFFQTGNELYDRYEVYRGKYLNFPGHKLPEDIAALIGSPEGAESNGDEAKPPTVDFRTETVLLDITGGERLPGRDRDLNSPGKLLLLDPEGNLVVHDELDDKPTYDQYQPPEEPKARKKKAKKATGDEMMDDDLMMEDDTLME